MFIGLKLFLARRNLKNALRHEEWLRDNLEYTRRILLPELEEKVEKLEVADEIEKLNAELGRGEK